MSDVSRPNFGNNFAENRKKNSTWEVAAERSADTILPLLRMKIMLKIINYCLCRRQRVFADIFFSHRPEKPQINVKTIKKLFCLFVCQNGLFSVVLHHCPC